MLSSMDGFHPYNPPSLELPGFVPARLSQGVILGVFGVYTVLIFAFGWSFSGRYKYLGKVDRILVCWWLFTGLVHLVLEGYFVVTPDFYKLPYTNFFAEVWKEYGKGDSRYPARDVTVVLIEGITAFVEGPAAILAAYAILYRKSYGHTLQLAISLGQLYGDALYFLTVFVTKEDFSAPGLIYFWGYFILMNSIWIVVPILVSVRSWKLIGSAFLKSNSQIKKIE